MKIAVLGPGGIGSTFAFQLAQAGHDVTVIARGKRLEQLKRDQSIVRTDGLRAAVQVSDALDEKVAWDLVLVPVLATQVDAVLAALQRSAAKTVMFMFNTFEPLGRLRDAVGAQRFAFGFPAILATVDVGRLTSQIVKHGLITTVTDAAWATVFTAVGIPSTVSYDMESWLRTHAVFVVPAMVASIRAYTRQAGISWREAMELAHAMEEGFRIVRQLGNAIVPAAMVPLSRLPLPIKAMLLWTMSRVPAVRKSGAAGPTEPRALIDAINATALEKSPALQAIRP